MSALDELSDVRAIKDILHLFCELLDTNQPQRIGNEIFTADGIDDHGSGIIVGRDSLNAYFMQVRESVRGSMHNLSNIIIEIDGDTASARSNVLAWMWYGLRSPVEPADCVLMGSYVDQLRRESDGWRISDRRVRPIGISMVAAGTLPEHMHDWARGFLNPTATSCDDAE